MYRDVNRDEISTEMCVEIYRDLDRDIYMLKGMCIDKEM